MKRPLFLLCVLTTWLCGCGGNQTGDTSRPGTDLAQARAGFTTTLRVRGPAPQDYGQADPPPGVREVTYRSGELELKAWLSEDPGDGVKRPAVVYLHGGWAFDPIDWEDAAPFVDAGYVLMMPILRAENGNPGVYEGFYGEVDDALAAGRFVAELPYVDPNNVFVAGHSVGAVLTVFAAMMPTNYRAAAALSGYLDMEDWASYEDPSRVVFDTTNPEEIRLRNPMAFVESLRVPLILYAENDGMADINADFLALAQQAGKPCELIVIEGDHMSMVAPAVGHAIDWFRQFIAP